MLWVFKRDPAINHEQGFVDVPDALVERLVREGKAATSYDHTLAMEPPQPGDGTTPPPRSDATAPPRDADDEAPPWAEGEASEPQEAAQTPTDEAPRRRPTRRP